MKITFKKFDKDFREYYNIDYDYTIGDEVDMQQVLYHLYNTTQFEISYNNEIIEIF